MRGRRLLILGLLGFLVISSLNGLQRRNYRAGWAAGYNTGQQQIEAAAPEAEAAPAQPAPQANYDGYQPHYHSPLGWFFGGLFRFIFFFFLISLFFKMIGFMMWRRGRWDHGRHHRGGGPRPPWHNHDWADGGSEKEKQPEDVEPDIQTH